MKRYFCFFLAVLITAMSIIFYCPFNIYANDAFTISKNSTEKTGLSADEAQKAIDANADIKGKDGVTMLLYTPSDSYNYTLKSGPFIAHLSDSQAKAMLMSKKSFQQYVVLCSSLISNGTVFRGFLKTVGIATTGDSNALTNIVDKFTCNYNYLDSINYDEDTQTITMDNTSVDKLREEIQRYYYQSIGLVRVPVTNKNPATAIDMHKSYYEYEEDYMSDYNAVAQYDYSAYCTRGDIRDVIAFDLSRYNYSYIDSANPTKNGIIFLDNQLNVVKSPFYHFSDFNDFDTDGYKWYISNFFISYEQWNMAGTAYFIDKKIDSNGNFKENYSWCDTIGGSTVVILSQKYKYFTTFSSYSALYNFLHGDQNAYLSSTIDKTGEDITFSIKDMNENLGSKMDTLIDSINSGKGNMSADELQNAIDKGLEDLNKNTEDIKDNTSDILDTLKEQNNILLQILGVTEYIAYQNDKYNNTYTKADMSNLFKKSFNRVSDAVLYGEKVDDDNENTVDRSKFSYHNGIFGHFPFSVPYQLYEWLKVFQAEPECPEFTYHYGFLIGISKDDDEYDKYKITFNLSAYDSWRKVAASFLKLSFTLTMAIGTYKKFKGEL